MKRTFSGMIEAGEPLMQEALVALRNYHESEAAGETPEQVERLRVLAESAFQVVTDYTSARDSAHVGLTGLEGDQSFIASFGDADNSLSMSWVKVGSNGSMNHACAAGGGWHPTATTLGGGVE